MAFPNATLTYTSRAKGINLSGLLAIMRAVPAPEAILEELGCFITSDAMTTAGSNVIRTIGITAAAPTPAAATLGLEPGVSGSPIASVAVTAAGAGYVRPPIGQVFESSTESLGTWLGSRGKGAKLQAYLGLISETATLVAGGTGYSAGTRAGLVGGMPLGTNRLTQARPGFGAVDPQLWTGSTKCGVRLSDPPAAGPLNVLGCVRAVSVKESGIGYNPATTKVVWTGAVPVATGRQPVAFPSFDAKGRCTKVTMVDMGEGYVTTPVPVLVDTTAPGGRGAVLRANMVRGSSPALTVTVAAGIITAVTAGAPGDGFVSMPKLVLWDPAGTGVGGSATFGPIPGTPSLFGVSRVDVLARGDGYVAPTVTLGDFYTELAQVAVNSGQENLLINAFANLMKTALQNVVGTAITETLS